MASYRISSFPEEQSVSDVSSTSQMRFHYVDEQQSLELEATGNSTMSTMHPLSPSCFIRGPSLLLERTAVVCVKEVFETCLISVTGGNQQFTTWNFKFENVLTTIDML